MFEYIPNSGFVLVPHKRPVSCEEQDKLTVETHIRLTATVTNAHKSNLLEIIKDVRLGCISI